MTTILGLVFIGFLIWLAVTLFGVFMNIIIMAIVAIFMAISEAVKFISREVRKGW